MIEQKSFRLDVKTVSDEGRVMGTLSPYGNVDSQGDVVVYGAFDKTVAEKNGVFPLLWQHNASLPIGIQLVTQTPKSLDTDALINLDKQLGREVFSDVKMWQKHGLQFGLSIGYSTVKARERKDGIRELIEVKLFEGSLVTFPANELATVSSAKSLNSIIEEIKAGRMLSAANLDALRVAIGDGESAISRLRALLTAAELPAVEKAAAHTETEPEVLHSFLTRLQSEIKGKLCLN
jgi:HK97 family phage prohead protease